MLDLARKLTLIEATINGDRQQPHATRLGESLTISNASGTTVSLEIADETLWLCLVPPNGERIDVTEEAVSDIVFKIEGFLLEPDRP